METSVRDEGGAIESPCVGLCRMDEVHGLCIGCWRTLDEIARWSQMEKHERAEIMAALPGRRRVTGQPKD